MVSHIQVLVTNFFPTPPIKLKLGLQGGRRLLIATHLDQSNYLANEKQGAVNKYELTVFIRLFQGSGSCKFFQGPSSPPVDSLDWIDKPQPCFPGQGHILSVVGDALSVQSPAVLQISGGNCGFNLLCFVVLDVNLYHTKLSFVMKVSHVLLHCDVLASYGKI